MREKRARGARHLLTEIAVSVASVVPPTRDPLSACAACGVGAISPWLCEGWRSACRARRDVSGSVRGGTLSRLGPGELSTHGAAFPFPVASVAAFSGFVSSRFSVLSASVFPSLEALDTSVLPGVKIGAVTLSLRRWVRSF